jgi:hypothetical protein
MDQLNDKEIRTIYFVYFHELVNRYSNETTHSHHVDGEKLFLSPEFQSLLASIRSTLTFRRLSDRPQTASSHPLLTFLDYFLPDLSLEAFILLLLALPKQVLF